MTLFSFKKNRANKISDTVEFRHKCIMVPEITLENRVIDDITKLKDELGSSPSPSGNKQLRAIETHQKYVLSTKDMSQRIFITSLRFMM